MRDGTVICCNNGRNRWRTVQCHQAMDPTSKCARLFLTDAPRSRRLMLELGLLIRDIPDFPKRGILFKDITTLLKNPRAFKQSIDQLTDLVRAHAPSVVIG